MRWRCRLSKTLSEHGLGIVHMAGLGAILVTSAGSSPMPYRGGGTHWWNAYSQLLRVYKRWHGEGRSSHAWLQNFHGSNSITREGGSWKNYSTKVKLSEHTKGHVMALVDSAMPKATSSVITTEAEEKEQEWFLTTELELVFFLWWPDLVCDAAGSALVVLACMHLLGIPFAFELKALSCPLCTFDDLHGLVLSLRMGLIYCGLTHLWLAFRKKMFLFWIIAVVVDVWEVKAGKKSPAFSWNKKKLEITAMTACGALRIASTYLLASLAIVYWSRFPRGGRICRMWGENHLD